MPHFQTIQAFRDQAFDLFVGQQPPVAAQIPRMGDYRNATGGLHRGLCAFPHRPRARFYPYAEIPGRPFAFAAVGGMHRKANPAADFYRMQSTGRWSGLWNEGRPKRWYCAIPTAPAWALGLLLLKAVL